MTRLHFLALSFSLFSALSALFLWKQGVLPKGEEVKQQLFLEDQDE